MQNRTRKGGSSKGLPSATKPTSKSKQQSALLCWLYSFLVLIVLTYFVLFISISSGKVSTYSYDRYFRRSSNATTFSAHNLESVLLEGLPPLSSIEGPNMDGTIELPELFLKSGSNLRASFRKENGTNAKLGNFFILSSTGKYYVN